MVGRNAALDGVRKRSRQVAMPAEDQVSDLDDAETPMAERLDDSQYRDDVLRDAFSDVLAHRVQFAAVIDHTGAVVGVLSSDAIARELAPGPAPVEPATAEEPA